MSQPPVINDVDLVHRALSRERSAISELVSLFEDRRPQAAARRATALAAVERHPKNRSAVVLGITGTPGSGKSSLLSCLVPTMLELHPELTIGILAVDPSSPISGGALLGDRTRMRMERDEPRLFFRSQASDTQLGGLSPSSFQVCRMMRRLFDCVFVETVGIGQSEADIRNIADRTYLVLQPLGGDEVQFLKAGIMEIPDAFILNKCDEPSAERSFHQLYQSLWLARPFDGGEVPIHKTSARTGAGIEELGKSLLEFVQSDVKRDPRKREAVIFERWVREEWGRNGSRFLADVLDGSRNYLEMAGGFDRGQQDFPGRVGEHFSKKAGR
ncbi:MAG TPA: hypothetical protein VH062_00585 [Polyangiaceae bacterium]|jgi:LAO/AO transport system kinase|nr:hypothetical protein [Polyangiaceae bacterium]